ncbi:act minimal PKS chain-length factor (CLF/KS beta) [Saccharothrix tamanrassetensis]|uniref:Act minimal PKS chain-length factor (CLF/KS beta) n=1 Tax=Saccharothrix tamanrassetensis TaxID=1051531 RepID=A0A841CJG4_9PSEU|nr:ketosynthase chain-length factor [Saccharothrix tamanrassetensis]MBB5957439.1 act minimal PKS chain-length factor (CLF/KS beta) [Saccharothrix tamanrassetensis]
MLPDTTIAFTGLGVIAPTGSSLEEHWASVLKGRSGIGPITRFDPTPYPVRLAGQVTDPAVAEAVPGRLVPQTDWWTHMALVAAQEAVRDAEVDPAALPEYEMAVVTASSSGGTEFGQREIERLWRDGPDHVGAYQSIAWFYAATTGQLSIRYGMRGPCAVLAGEQAGGLDALGHARRLARADCRLVVTGGTDASLSPYGLVAQLPTGLLSTVDDPDRAYLPFDVNASGYLPGEGGAVLIAEELGAARARGRADGYGVLLGYAAGFDPPPGSTRPPALERVLGEALRDAGLGPSEVDVVFADAMGVPGPDLAEARAISAVFGPRGVPVTAPKTLTGRLYGGGAALDAVTALLALRDGVVPHTVGPERLAPGCDIDLVVDRPRELPLRHAVVLARGYGGFTSAVVLGRAAPTS